MTGIPATLQHLAVPTANLRPYARNPRNGDTDAIVESLRVNGQYRPIVVREQTGEVLAGNHTLAAALELGWEQVAATYVSCTDEEAARIVLVDNRTNDLARYDDGLLAQLLVDLPDLAGTGFDDAALAALLESLTPPVPEGDRLPGPTLADRFLVPPFTVLDARKGWWQDRKREWQAMGMRGEDFAAPAEEAWARRPPGTQKGPGLNSGAGRRDDLMGAKGGNAYAASKAITAPDGSLTYVGERATTSIFDPVLCEVIYRWFAPPRGKVLDPYAGGSVRGLVAAALGLDYLGLELRAEQVAANVEQLPLLADRDGPVGTAAWVHGDNLRTLPELKPDSFDLAFTCPPYFDLEVYSDEEGDHSRLSDEDFAEAYGKVMEGCYRALREHSYAVFVIGNARDPKGLLRDLGGLTVRAAEAAGFRFYNDAILITPSGSLALRAGRAFSATRVLGRTHQLVYVFVKGDRRRAAERQGELQLTDALAALEPTELTEDDPVPAEPDPEPAPDEELPAGDGQTPVQRWGQVWVKRDDLFTVGEANGGKARTILALARQDGVRGLIGVGSRQSPQPHRVAAVAAVLGLPCRLHVPAAKHTPPELEAAVRLGAELVEHRPGYNTVIVKRSEEDAETSGWTLIPFGADHPLAVELTAQQAQTLRGVPCSRLVVTVGSGVTLAGILTGLARYELDLPVLGVRIGGDPSERLARLNPPGLDRVEWATSDLPYAKHAPNTDLAGLELDPVYEAKALPYLRPGDLLWIVGKRT